MTCSHEKLQREFSRPQCDCSQCAPGAYNYLVCQACDVEVLREGAPGFEELWSEAPNWFNVE